MVQLTKHTNPAAQHLIGKFGDIKREGNGFVLLHMKWRDWDGRFMQAQVVCKPEWLR